MKFKFLSILLSFLVVLPLFSSCKREKRTEYSFEYFDTVTTVIAYGETEKKFSENCEKIFSELSRYHKAYDIYKTYEGVVNLATVNSSDGEVKAEKEIIDLLLFAKELHSKTGGKLNVALGSVLSLWHYEREKAENNPSSASLPKEDSLRRAAEHTDIENIVLNSEKGTVRRLDPELKIDVGAVGKGYAVERVAEFMENEGMTGYLLNVGGNIRAVGAKNKTEKWDVAIENPEGEEGYIEYLSVDDMAVVTSGVYQRYYIVGGKSYHHIIDPDTLYPSENYLSVTVVSKDSGLSDALSTALFNMTIEEGKETIKNFPETEVLWVDKNGEKYYSDGFSKYIKK